MTLKMSEQASFPGLKKKVRTIRVVRSQKIKQDLPLTFKNKAMLLIASKTFKTHQSCHQMCLQKCFTSNKNQYSNGTLMRPLLNMLLKRKNVKSKTKQRDWTIKNAIMKKDSVSSNNKILKKD
jgi:hypothetical protein